MRVIHVVQTLVAGGAETMIRTLAPGLSRAGVDVRIVSVYPAGLDARGLAELGTPTIDLARRGRRDLGYFPRLVRTLRALRPDIVHTHLHTGQYAGRAAALIARAPAIVLTSHGDEPGGPVRAAIDRYLHARTDRFVVFTEAQRRRFANEQAVPLERVAVIPNGVRTPVPAASRAALRSALGIAPGAFAAYSVGRLAPEKNQRSMLAALARLREQGLRDVVLILAGTGPLEDELRAAAAELGIQESVRFLGHRSDAPALAAAMDLFLLTSERERMPMALGEAMLAGLPPLTTPWAGATDVVADGTNGYVAGGFDANAVAAAWRRAYVDRDLLARAGAQAARDASAAFSVDAMVDAHVALYTSLTARGAR